MPFIDLLKDLIMVSSKARRTVNELLCRGMQELTGSVRKADDRVTIIGKQVISRTQTTPSDRKGQ
jgi:hypothetical protein